MSGCDTSLSMLSLDSSDSRWVRGTELVLYRLVGKVAEEPPEYYAAFMPMGLIPATDHLSEILFSMCYYLDKFGAAEKRDSHTNGHE